MFSQKLVLRLLAMVMLVAFLAGCNASPTATVAPTTAPATAAPTVDQQPTFNAIKTQAVQTVVANMTQNAPTAAPATATNTAQPTATPLPTNPPATSTPTFIPWTLTPTPGPYSCSITSTSPASTTSYATNADIDGVWVVKNNGTQTWLSGETDVRYSSGTKLQKNGDILDLKNNVAPGESYTVGIDMRTPTSAGTYTTSWIIITGKTTICTLNLTVKVQ